jgi:glycine hydroxymethyltransferase
VALKEASTAEFSAYAHQIVTNAKALAAAMIEDGFELVSGGTDNHLILADLTSKGIGGKPAAQAMDRAGIELNYNTVPYDPRKPFDPSGIRIGTSSVTTRGLTEEHMPQISAWMDGAIAAAKDGDEGSLARIRGEVADFVKPFPIPGWPR